MKIGGQILTGLALLIILFLLASVAQMIGDTVNPPRPMPCNQEQVYVWEDYPIDAKCVSSRDHSQHGE